MNCYTLKISDLCIETIQNRSILSGLHLTLGPGDRLAVIGAEGVGKSTLLAAIARQLAPTFRMTGHIETGHVGLFTQQLEDEWSAASVPYYLLCDRPDDEPDWLRYQSAYEALHRLRLPTEWLDDFEKRLSNLSGGELMRVRLGRLLLQQPDILLFDEPTNYIDLRTVRWLQDFILGCTQPVIFVTHDESLIENCANKILYLQHTEHNNQVRHIFSGTDYQTFLATREHEVLLSEQDVMKRQSAIKSVKRDLSERQSSGAAKLRQGKETAEGMHEKNSAVRGALKHDAKLHRIKTKLAELAAGPEALKRDEEIAIDFPLSSVIAAGKRVIDFHAEQLLNVGGRRLSDAINLQITGPQRVFITGANGAGKTTFLRQLVAQLMQAEGIVCGVLPQDTSEILSQLDRPAAAFLDDVQQNKSFNRTVLKRLGFERVQLECPVGRLSGGQKIKLLLARLVVQGANVLVLDEPTTNLSPLSMASLTETLRDFPGALLVVSHDRKLIRSLATHIYELSSHGLERFDIEGI